MRDFQTDYDNTMNGWDRTFLHEQRDRSQSLQKEGKSPKELNDALLKISQNRNEAEEQARKALEETFLKTIMPDASYVQRKLLARLNNDESWLSPAERRNGLIFKDGLLAGIYPIRSAADYLDALYRKVFPDSH